MPKATPRPIQLALQGGGSHGAMTWGVLDRLLEDDRLAITGLSGTSAGAMNAAVLADGLAAGGRDGARQALEIFWRAVSRAGRLSPLRRSAIDRWLGNWSLDRSPVYEFFDRLSRTFSPYEFNPLNVNPLTSILEQTIDFERLNRANGVPVFVTATNVRTGLPAVFRQPALSAESLLASAALPFLYQAVEIDGEAYWDGGYTGNPALFPLIDQGQGGDLVLIQLNPFVRNELPRSARDIINRLNEITFNASLLKELRAGLLIRQLAENDQLSHPRYGRVRLHRVHADEDLVGLSASSKLNVEWEYLTHLFQLGRTQAARWLDEYWDALGERSTFDPSFMLPEHLMTPAASIEVAS